MKDPKALFEHILESISRIEKYTQEGREHFLAEPIIQDAVIRNLEIIGEAVKGVDESVRLLYPNIPWKSIAGMRDFLIHVYFGVKLETVWKTIDEDVPALKEVVRDYLANRANQE